MAVRATLGRPTGEPFQPTEKDRDAVEAAPWAALARLHRACWPMADCARPAESACPVVVAYRWQMPPGGPPAKRGAATGFGGAR